MKTFEWTSAPGVAVALRAQTVTVAGAMLTASGEPAADPAILKAGGIDLLDLMKEGLLTPRRVVDLRGIPELGRVTSAADGTLAVGAMVTLAQVAAHPLIRDRYRALALAAAGSASPQIRNVATLGGNLLQRPRCWYFRSREHHCVRKGGASCFAFNGENQRHALFAHTGCAMVHPSTPATALVALGAQAELFDAGGRRRAVPLEQFFVGPRQDIERENVLLPGEILTAVLLPAPLPGAHSTHLRQGELDSFDWPIADVAVVLDLGAGTVCKTASVVLGAAAPVPWRARGAEAALAGKPVSVATARAAATAAIADAAPLSRNAWKIPVFEALVRRAILEAAGPA